MTRQHMLINLTDHFLFFFYNSQTLLTFSELYPSTLQLHFQAAEFFHGCFLPKKDYYLFHSHPYCHSYYHLVFSLYSYPFVPSNNSFTFHFLIFQISSLQCNPQLQSLSNTPSSLVQLSLRCPKFPLTDISCL